MSSAPKIHGTVVDSAPSTLSTRAASGPVVPQQGSSAARRPQLPNSGPGVRWKLSAKRVVRFTKDLTRVYGEEAPHRKVNLVKMDYLTDDASSRPSDVVLAELIRLAMLPAGHASLTDHGRRCWLLTEDSAGWTLALELRGGPQGRLITPGRDSDGNVIGKRIPTDLTGALTVAHDLLAAALERTENPDAAPHELILEQLRAPRT